MEHPLQWIMLFSFTLAHCLPSILLVSSRTPKWHISELLGLSYIFEKLLLYSSCLYLLATYYALSLCFSNFHSYTNHLGTSVKRKILIQHCGVASEIPHSYQVPRRCQQCWSAACTFRSKVLSHMSGITGTEMHIESTWTPPSASVGLPRLHSLAMWPWENWPSLFENLLSPLQNKDTCPHVSDFLQCLSVVFSLLTL